MLVSFARVAGKHQPKSVAGESEKHGGKLELARPKFL